VSIVTGEKGVAARAGDAKDARYVLGFFSHVLLLNSVRRHSSGGAPNSLNPIGGACMKQGRLVFECAKRRGSEKDRGWMALLGETAFREDASRGAQNLTRGVVAATDRAFGRGAVRSRGKETRVQAFGRWGEKVLACSLGCSPSPWSLLSSPRGCEAKRAPDVLNVPILVTVEGRRGWP
jgi:hypothetical protein